MISTPGAAVVLVATATSSLAQPFFGRHPWVFAGAIDRVEGDPDIGATVSVHAADGAWLTLLRCCCVKSIPQPITSRTSLAPVAP